MRSRAGHRQWMPASRRGTDRRGRVPHASVPEWPLGWGGFSVGSSVGTAVGSGGASVGSDVGSVVGAASQASPSPSPSLSVWSGIGNVAAIVDIVGDAVLIGVWRGWRSVAGVADSVAIGVCLIGVGEVRAIVTFVWDAITIGVRRGLVGPAFRRGNGRRVIGERAEEDAISGAEAGNAQATKSMSVIDRRIGYLV